MQFPFLKVVVIQGKIETQRRKVVCLPSNVGHAQRSRCAMIPKWPGCSNSVVTKQQLSEVEISIESSVKLVNEYHQLLSQNKQHH